MKRKIIGIFITTLMIFSAFTFTAFANEKDGITTKDTSAVFNVPKTTITPKLDGNIDSCYRQIFSMKGSQAIKKDGKPDKTFPLDGNRNGIRYDVAEHPKREESDWWNCTITGYATWDATYLYLIVDIKNASQLDDNPDANWAGDSIQVSVFKETNESGTTTDYTFAQDNGKITVTMNLGNTISRINLKKVAYDSNKYGRAPSGFIKVSDKEKGNYTYELALEWAALGIKSSDKVNFNCSINLNDENMDPITFCGFQITNGIYNEKDQKTKSGMAYAISMIFEGEGGNSKTTADNKQTEVKGNTEKPDDKDTPAKNSDRRQGTETPKTETPTEEIPDETPETPVKESPVDPDTEVPTGDGDKLPDETKPAEEITEKDSGFPVIFIIIPVIIVVAGSGIALYFYMKAKRKSR